MKIINVTPVVRKPKDRNGLKARAVLLKSYALPSATLKLILKLYVSSDRKNNQITGKGLCPSK